MTPSWEVRGGSAKELRELGYDTIRIHLDMSVPNYPNQLELIPETIRDCTANGIDVVLNIRNTEHDFAAVEAEWEKLIPLYDGKKAVIAYELVNEPFNKAIVYEDYIHGMVKRLRLLTDKIFIIGAGGGPTGVGFELLTPIDDNNIIYAFHMYWPYPYTQQGLRPNSPTGLKWHGDYYNAPRDRSDLLHQDCRWAIAFQEKYNVRMAVTELGVSTHSDDKSANQWFADVIGICKEHKWDYFIHAYPISDDSDFKFPQSNWS